MIVRPDGAAWRWIPPGQRAAIGAHVIPGGLIYVGQHLGSAEGVEPALVNPALPVTAPDGRTVDPGTGPRLAYHLLSPGARWSYLDWLSRGRRTDVPPGLVLLFCFGLERRVLLDADHDPAVRGELPAIAAEVRRLRARYGEGGGRILRTTVDNLVDLVDLLAAPRATPGPAGPVAACWDGDAVTIRRDSGAVAVGRASGAVTVGRDGDAPTSVGIRTALARLAAAAAPVPADLARAWVRQHPSLLTRGVEVDCPAEFDRMFALLYRDRYGSGLVPPDDVPGVRLRYRPASPGLTTTLVCREDLPDVLIEPRCTRALASLVDGVAGALGPYHRWLVRFPEGRDSLAAAALLPRELVNADHGQLGALRVWAERQLDGRPWAVIDASGFWEFWSTAARERMARDEATALIGVLALLDIGVEPDVRFGAPALARGPAVLFRLGRPASEHPGARFPAAAAIVRCAAAVASAARRIHPHDPLGAAVIGTCAELAAALRLGPGEDLRLAARLAWLLTSRVDIDRLGRQSSVITAAGREVAGQHLVTVATAADPESGPATVAALTRVYKILGLEPDLVFNRLHERAVGVARHTLGVASGPSHPARQTDPTRQAGPVADPRTGSRAGPERPCPDGRDAPVVVRVADTTPSGYALPWAADHTPAGVKLDRALITRKVAESAVAAELLDTIFCGEDATGEDTGAGDGWTTLPDAPGTNRLPVGTNGISGMGGVPSAMVRALAARPTWTREEFTSLATAYRMLPDGALDLLNELAIERAGAPVIEDDGTLTVDSDVLSELLP